VLLSLLIRRGSSVSHFRTELVQLCQVWFCSSSVYVLLDTESDMVGGSGNSNNVIMISKAVCICLKNWIYPVVAPRDKKQVSVVAPTSNV
jgi:hypothetical protein